MGTARCGDLGDPLAPGAARERPKGLDPAASYPREDRTASIVAPQAILLC